MSAIIDIDPDKIAAQIEANIDAGMPILTSEILKSTNQYVKRDQDTLMNSALTATDFERGTIIYNTKYARRQYYTGKARRLKNQHATTRWFRVAKMRHSDEWAEQAATILTKGGGGVG